MCTAITYQTNDFYFGRNLDYEFSYGESVTVTPRRYPFCFTNGKKCASHAAFIGMAHVADGYPLYYDAVNEYGLGMAGLNFPSNAHYFAPEEVRPGEQAVAAFEFIPYILCTCRTLKEARELLSQVRLVNLPFSPTLPPSPLHYLIADKTGCITVEATHDGLHIYDNPVGVLTNNPPFPMQLFNLNNYMALSAKSPENTFAPGVPLTTYSRGMGAMGLPGDLSSQSRFVRVAFVRAHSLCQPTEEESVSQFFHILHSVEQQRGCCELDGGKYEITLYTSCCNATRGIYYYTTYENSQITAVDLHKENLDSDALIRYPVIQTPNIFEQN